MNGEELKKKLCILSDIHGVIAGMAVANEDEKNRQNDLKRLLRSAIYAETKAFLSENYKVSELEVSEKQKGWLIY